nr:uncharacterized protein LOC127294220 isoform X3 [Lolium perenne]
MARLQKKVAALCVNVTVPQSSTPQVSPGALRHSQSHPHQVPLCQHHSPELYISEVLEHWFQILVAPSQDECYWFHHYIPEALQHWFQILVAPAQAECCWFQHNIPEIICSMCFFLIPQTTLLNTTVAKQCPDEGYELASRLELILVICCIPTWGHVHNSSSSAMAMSLL